MPTDWVAQVFAAMRDCGEDISIVYGTAPAADAAPTWFQLPHDRFDGMSGLVKLLRDRGLDAQAPTLQGDRFTLRRCLQGLRCALPSLKLRPRRWQRFDASLRLRYQRVRDRLAWRILRQGETDAIRAAARAEGVTVNTYLLHHLDAAVAQRLTPAATGRLWMVPVNLRGAVTRPVEAAPHMAFLGVNIEGESGPGRLQAQITRLRQQGYHWGTWILLHAGRLFGAKALRKDYLQRQKRGHGWTGIFSNLGAWNVPGSGHWVFGPAVSRVHPVGAGCVTMNGRMALSVQLHDGFGSELALAQALLDDWVGRALGPALPGPDSFPSQPSTLQQEATHG